MIQPTIITQLLYLGYFSAMYIMLDTMSEWMVAA